MNGHWDMQISIKTSVGVVFSVCQFSRELYDEDNLCENFMHIYGDESYPYGCFWKCDEKNINWNNVGEVYRRYKRKFDFDSIRPDQVDDTFVLIIVKMIINELREVIDGSMFVEEIMRYNEDNMLSLGEDVPAVTQYIHFLVIDNLAIEIKRWIKEAPKNHREKKSGCFITTAVCESLNKTDDCYELNMFRNFRDGWLRKEKDGETLIRQYYEVAPDIVRRINALPEAQQIYYAIWNRFLLPCLRLLEQEKYDKCKKIYIHMVKLLGKKYC